MAKQLGPKGGETTVTKGGYERTQILLDHELKNALLMEAARRRVSLSELIRTGMAEYLGLEE